MIFGKTYYSFMLKWIYLSEIELSMNVKQRYQICLRFGEKLLTYLPKLGLETKTSICFTIKKTIFIMSNVFGFCCRCHKLTHFCKKVSITKKHIFFSFSTTKLSNIFTNLYLSLAQLVSI